MSLPDGAWLGIGQLYLAAVFVGGLWQFETDLSCWLANMSGGFVYMAVVYDLGTVISNFLVFGILHSFFFYISTRLLKASWAEKTIDLQVGCGGFGFYMAGYYFTTSGSYLLRSLNAGFWTSFYSLLPAIAYMYKWYEYGD
jgi:hypothetical protein